MTYEAAMKLTSRQLNIRGTITLSDATVISLTSTHIMSYTINEGGSFIPLGTAASTSYTLELDNSLGQWFKGGSILGYKPIMGASVYIEIAVYHDGAYEYKDAGYWYVNKPSGREGGRFVLRGNDSLMTNYETKYADTLTYPDTLNNVLAHIKSKGITITGTLACNGTVSIPSLPDWGENCTLRGALSYVAMAGGCFVRVTRAGALELVATKNASAAKTLSTAEYLELDNQNAYFEFNRVKIMPRGAAQGTAYTEGAVNAGLPEANNNTIVINDNPVLFGANLQTLANGLAAALTGYEVELATFRWRGDPTFVIGDNLALTDRLSETTATQIIQQQIRYETGMSADISCQLNLETMLPSAISANGTISPAAFGQGSLDPNVLIANLITVDYANVKDLNAGTAIFQTGLGDDLFIGRLIVTDANLLTATIGQLMVRDADGDLWKITIANDGTVSATAVTVDGANISDNGVMSVSQRLLWRQATAPSAPFIGMLWQDTTAEQLKRCTATSPLTWEVIPAGEVHTSVIDVDNNGMTVASTGTIDLLSGSTLTIKQLGDAANVITMDNGGMSISSSGTLELASASQITIGTNPLSVGGTNLLLDTDYEISAGNWSLNTPSTAQTLSAATAKFGTKSLRIVRPASDASGGIYKEYTNFIIGQPYTFSMWVFKNSDHVWSMWCSTGGVAPITNNGAAIWTWARYSYTFTPTATSGILYLIAQDTAAESVTFIERPKLEVGNIATAWREAEGELHNSSITIDADGIEILSGGDLIATAPGTLQITGGSTNATAIAMRNDTDYFISAGHLTQSSAPFYLKKDGSIKASAGVIGGFSIASGILQDTATSGGMIKLDPAAGATYYKAMLLGTSGMSPNWAYFSGNFYVESAVSALSFTDRTPSYDGDALADLKPVKGKDGKIDHKTLPKVARVKTSKNGVEQDERDLGMMISILTKAVQQLTDRIEKLEAKA